MRVSGAMAGFNIYQAFIFLVPIIFALVLFFLFYLFYLRSRRVDWSSLQMRTFLHNTDDISRSELGLKKEFRELLPIIVYKESFSINDTQCAVCLADYHAEDRLQQIPGCRHTFHMECIDCWLSSHTTCPLCRLPLFCAAKADSTETFNIQVVENNNTLSNISNGDESLCQSGSHTSGETNTETRTDDGRLVIQSGAHVEESLHCIDQEKVSSEVGYENVHRECKDELPKLFTVTH